MIHRADALQRILALTDRKYGAIDIWPVHSRAEEPAIRVIVRMIRNRKTPLRLHPPVVLFDSNGQQSAQAQSLLRDGVGLV